MNFSKGQLIFALLFLVAFIVFMVFSYRKDKGSDKNYFKGTYKIIVTIIVVSTLLFLFVTLKSLHYF